MAVDTYAGVFYQVNFFKVSLKPETGLLSPSENQIGSFPGEPETRPTKSKVAVDKRTWDFLSWQTLHIKRKIKAVLCGGAKPRPQL